MDPTVRAALESSHLRILPTESLRRLTDHAVQVSIPAGTTTHRAGEPAPHLELVVAGLVRVFVTAPDGRAMTVRYCRPGALIGVVSLFGDRFTMPATTQALIDAEVLRLSPTVARTAARDDPLVAGAFLRELSERVVSFIGEIPTGAFASVRQRVIRHLLDLASQPRAVAAGGSGLAVAVTQGQLAEAVGTAREVVVRILRELRVEGLIRTERGRIVIVDPHRLVREQQIWNLGS